MRGSITYVLTFIIAVGLGGCGDDIKKPSGTDPDQSVTTKGGTAMLTYDGTAMGTLITEDFNIEIYEGTGLDYAWGTAAAPQVFNGAVDYDACTQMPD